jgi:hypothetical protein
MKVIIYAVVNAVVTVALTGVMAQPGVMAQVVPSADRLQQFSRDLTPSSAQDFFRAGQAQMEQEIRWLLVRRLAHLTDILQVKPVTLPKDRDAGSLPATPRPQPPEKS